MATPASDDPRFNDLLGDLEGLDEKELRDLIERSARIQATVETFGWQHLVDYLTAITTAHQRRILSGSCKDMESYRYEVGLVDGIQAAISAPHKLFERVARLQRYMDADAADADS